VAGQAAAGIIATQITVAEAWASVRDPVGDPRAS
jgi:hypothetical protein